MVNKAGLIIIVLCGILGIGAAALSTIVNMIIAAILLTLLCLTLISLRKKGRKTSYS